jgi:hypothetical protein
MRKAILLAALAFGCDDPEVASRAANVLEHGIVNAQITCVDVPVNSGSWMTFYRANKLQDGSSFSRAKFGHGNVEVQDYCSRDQDCAPVAAVGLNSDFSTTSPGCPGAASEAISAKDGFIEYCLDNVGVFDSFDIETYCTGFNLEAFGVEP